MALRTSSVRTSSATPVLPAEGRRRVELAMSAAAARIAAGDLDGLAAVWADVATWEDRQRAYQAQCRLTEVALAHRPDQADGWIGVFFTTAACLLDALEANPREPTILNQAGVFLYELCEAAAAIDLFKATLRLDPEHPHTRTNLAQAKTRVRSKTRLPGVYATRTRPLAARARRLAALARAVGGLRLSLCMIVKDEEEMLPGCLEPLQGVVDEMIVVDTGSSDRTVEIAESFGAKVVSFPWNGSFADARNASIEAATGDWVMYLDADEHMEATDAHLLRTLLGRTWREGFYLVETNYTGGDDAGSATTHLALRLWRNRPAYRFEGRIHEQKSQAMPTYLPERFETTTIRVRHYGYLNQRIASKDKSRRNLELLEQEAREAPSPFNDYNLGSEYLALAEPVRAREHFDRSWETLSSDPGFASAGYVPLLASRRARARREAGDHAAALAAVEDGLRVYPDHTDLVMESALVARAQGRVADAEELLRRCIEMGDAPSRYAATAGTGTFLALTLLAEIELDRGDDAAAEELLRRSLDEHPHYVAPALPLVDLLTRRGAAAEDIAAIVPDRPSAQVLAATALHEAGRPEDAEVWFRRVLAAQPQNPVARVGLAEALLAQSRFAEAAAAAAAEPSDSPLAGAAARVRLFAAAVERDAAAMEGILAEAEHALEPEDLQLHRAWAAAIRGDESLPWVNAAAGKTAGTLLEALLRVRQVEAFVGLLRVFETLAVDPRERREFLARVYLRRGYLESAADEWIAVVRNAPDARALLGLSQVAVARGYLDDASAFAAEALVLEPGNRDAALLLEAITLKNVKAA